MDNAAKEINKLFSDYNKEEPTLVGMVNNLISKVEIGEQLRIHSYLTADALEGIFKLRDQLLLNQSVKEHIVWFYFKQKVAEIEIVEDFFLEELFNEYKREKFIALESIIIDLLKWEKVAVEQMERIKEVFGEKKHIKKQMLSNEMKSKINNKGVLSKTEVAELLDANVFDILEYALDKQAVSDDALNIFDRAMEGERHNKNMQVLYEMASKLKNKTE